MFSDALVISAYKKAESFNLWEGNFKQYANRLHDEGFIFKRETYKSLEKAGIELEYSKDAWALKFYERWLKEGLWSLKESVALLQGKDPRKDKRNFEDLSQNPFIINFLEDEPKAWEIFDDDFFKVEERLLKHVVMGDIEAFELNDKKYYKPYQIVPWMSKNIPVIPPDALLKVLLPKHGECEGVKENKDAKEIQIREASEGEARKRNQQILECIAIAWSKAKGKARKNPSAGEVWSTIKGLQDDFECIQSIEVCNEAMEECIFWHSATAGDQRMTRGTFGNKVSEFNTKRHEDLLKSLNNFNNNFTEAA